MVKYYGRARQRIGSVNTNQLGLKMSGCPSRVGRNPVINRYIKQRVNCMQGTCGPIQIHGVNVPSNKFRNNPPYCKKRSTTCLAAAGGIGNIKTPYYRTPAPGEKGCGCKFGSCDGGFVLKAGFGVFSDGDEATGYISPSYNILVPSKATTAIGSLKGEDDSPIKNQDILLFVSALDGGDEGGSYYIMLLKFTPEVKKYLASKGQSDGGDGATTYYGLILNINGKEYQGSAGFTLDDDGSPESLITFVFFAGGLGPASSVPALKQGETYNFSFK
jgi:hypothetical protein